MTCPVPGARRRRCRAGCSAARPHRCRRFGGAARARGRPVWVSSYLGQTRTGLKMTRRAKSKTSHQHAKRHDERIVNVVKQEYTILSSSHGKSWLEQDESVHIILQFV